MSDKMREDKINKENDYEFKHAEAELARDLLTGNLSPFEQQERYEKLQKLEVESVVPKQIRDIYTMGADRIYKYAEANGLSEAEWEKLYELDRLHVENGFRKTLKFGGKSGGRGRSGGKGSRGGAKFSTALLSQAMNVPKTPTPRQARMTARRPSIPKFSTRTSTPTRRPTAPRISVRRGRA
jgi:hypothetical protein